MGVELSGIDSGRARFNLRPTNPQAYQCIPTLLQMLAREMGVEFSPETPNGYSYHPGGWVKVAIASFLAPLDLNRSYKNRGTSIKFTVTSSLTRTSNYRSALVAFNSTYDLE